MNPAFHKEKEYTIEDIYALPDGKRAELIDGQIYSMAHPSRTHQKISGYLYHEIYDYIKQRDGKCEVYAAPFAVFLNNDDQTYLEPDLSVICDTDSKLIVKHAKISWESRANRLSQRPVSKNITPCLNYYNINDTPGYF